MKLIKIEPTFEYWALTVVEVGAVEVADKDDAQISIQLSEFNTAIELLAHIDGRAITIGESVSESKPIKDIACILSHEYQEIKYLAEQEIKTQTLWEQKYLAEPADEDD